jgi:hypothetical protein
MWMKTKETIANVWDDLETEWLVSSGNVLPWNISSSALSRIWLVSVIYKH